MTTVREEQFVPLCLLSGGVPRAAIHIMTARGIVIWCPDGSVRAPLYKDGLDFYDTGPVNYVSLTRR